MLPVVVFYGIISCVALFNCQSFNEQAK